ncbi:hematopoietic prostaglandin D synthase-like [Lineus longissimus]|uniref:hematopoietic prostaglandin D synthase-like n=1 Tax=Lineus longissimus TaxID=88925 RepID=UPI002B4EEF79
MGNSCGTKGKIMPGQRYRLLYFNARGRAELARLILAATGVDYEDVRFEKEEWPKIKQTIHFEEVPILEVDGKQINQSYAIARFLAREHGLYGKDAVEMAGVDAVVDTLEDMMKPIYTIYLEENKEKMSSMLQKYKENTLKHYMQKFEEYLAKEDTEYFVGSSLTWADLHYINCMSWVTLFVPDALDNHPRLINLKNKIESLPRIANWLDTRPITNY